MPGTGRKTCIRPSYVDAFMHSELKEIDENYLGGLLLYLFPTIHAWLYRGNSNNGTQISRQEQQGHHLGAASLDQYALQINEYVRFLRHLCQKILLIPCWKRNRYYSQNKNISFYLPIRPYISSQWQGHHEAMRRVALVYHEIQYQYPDH